MQKHRTKKNPMHTEHSSNKELSMHSQNKHSAARSQGMPRVSTTPLRQRQPANKNTPPQPVNGARLLDDIEHEIRKYIWLPYERDYTVLAVWALYTHVYDAFDHAPRLALHSALPGSGKSELMRVLAQVVLRGRHYINATPAVLFRHAKDSPGTLLLDEFDKEIQKGGLGDLHAILNAGHTRGLPVPRMDKNEADNYEVGTYDPFGPVAFGVLRKELPGDLADRSIPIRMERGKGGEYRKFKHALHAGELHALRQRAATWASQKHAALVRAEPDMQGIENRAGDNWLPLFAVADAAGGPWPQRIRASARRYEQAKSPTDPALILLNNLRDLYDELYDGDDFIATETLLAALIDNPEWPWAEWRYGAPLTSTGLSKLLRPLGPEPHQPKRGAARGYYWQDFAAAWKKHGSRPVPSTTRRGAAASGTSAASSR